MIKVLQVVTTMNVGGIETMLMNIYRHIDRSKIQFDFLTHRSEKFFFEDEINKLGGIIYRVPSIHPKHHFRYIQALEQFFSEHKEFSIVHAHISMYSMYVLRAARKAGISIRIAHAHVAEKHMKFDIRLPFKIYARSRINNVFTDRFSCGEMAGKYLFRNESFVIIPNSIDVEKFRFSKETRIRVREKLELNEKLVIGHVGSFSKTKNQQFIVKILSKIISQNKQLMLLLVGDGKYKEKVMLLAKEKSLCDNIVFLGIRPDINELLQAMDILVLPSLYEGFPVTLVEAQAAGLPCVVSDTVSKEIAITDLVKFVSLSKNPEEWAKIVLEKAKSTNRRDYSEEVKKAGFDVMVNTKWLQDFYLTRHHEALELKR